MAGWVRRFIEVDDARANERFEIPLQGSTSYGDWGEMPGANEELVVVLEKQWPVASVDGRGGAFWFDGIVWFDFGDFHCHIGDTGIWGRKQ